MKILVVDDDPDQSIIRCMLLGHHGFETIRASDAAAALRVAVAQHPDCAVVDVRLPGETTGLNLVRDLKDALPELIIFILTGADPERLRNHPETQAAQEIISKGSSSKILLDKLKRISAQRAA